MAVRPSRDLISDAAQLPSALSNMASTCSRSMSDSDISRAVYRQLRADLAS